jgi:hypothetical protein
MLDRQQNRKCLLLNYCHIHELLLIIVFICDFFIFNFFTHTHTHTHTNIMFWPKICDISYVAMDTHWATFVCYTEVLEKKTSNGIVQLSVIYT